MDCQFIANIVDIVGLLSVGSQILGKKNFGKKIFMSNHGLTKL